MAGFDRGAITDEKYRTFLENVNHKMESMMEEVRKVKVSIHQEYVL